MTAVLTSDQQRAVDIANGWRLKADKLDEYAACCRRSGDPFEARDAEACAVERLEADALEAIGSVAAYRDQRASQR